MDDNRDKGQWFVVQTLSGQEKRVLERIQHGIDVGEASGVYEVSIPTEKVTEVRQGVKKTVTRKIFPGYVLVRMDYYCVSDGRITSEVDEKNWSYVKNTQGVIGFVSVTPLSETEVDDIFRRSGDEETARPKIAFELGEVVRIRNGAFENYEGTVQEIDNARGKLKLLVSIFGRSTPVELEFWQVDREI